VGILAPGEDLAAFRDDASKVRVCQPIHPRAGVACPCGVVIRTRAVGVNPPSPLEKIRSVRRRPGRRRGFVAAISDRANARNGYSATRRRVDLSHKSPLS